VLAANSFGAEINTCQGYAYVQMQKLIPGLAKVKSYQDIGLTTTTVGSTTIQIDGGGLLDQAYTSTKNALASIPASKNVVIYAIGDDMAVGAQRALDQAGRSKTAMLGGFGGDPESLNAVRGTSSWVAEGDAFYTRWGEYALAMVPFVLDKKTMPVLTTAPAAVLTRKLKVAGTSIIPIGDLYASGETEAKKLPPLVAIKSLPLPGVGKNGTVGNAYLAQGDVLKKFGNVTGVK
jgi:hypothetical protein